jgi:hypothetical protein
LLLSPRWLLPLLWLCGGAAAAPACPGPAPAWQVLQVAAPQAWLLQGAEGEATAANRGQVSNLVLVREGRRLWLLGAGPTPAFARALDCHVRQRFGQPVSDVIVPWPHAESALGLAGFPHARLWAHADVAAAMGRQCATCREVLQARLGAAAADLDGDILLPAHRLSGDSGELGPWRWWALRRSDEQVALVWRLRSAPLFVATGWLWGDAPPDARLADVQHLQEGTRQLLALAAPDGAAARWLGEQGAVQDALAPQRAADYWQAVQAAVDGAFARGELPATAPPLPGVAASWQAHPQHALNWQRAWRQAEDRFLRGDAPR